METKKNKDKSADALRMPMAFTGLLFTGGLVLASFSYVTPIEEELESVAMASENEIKYVQEDAKPPEDVQQPEDNTYVAPPQPDIIIDSNTVTPPAPTPPVIGPVSPVITPRPAPAPEIVDFPDVEAAFPGGAAALQQFIGNNVIYPETSIDMDEQGKVYLSFVVEKDGKISNVNVERGVSKDLDREAKRVVRAMPKWDAGEVKGKKVRTRCRLPIVFTLN